jgi:ubiquinone/menaquinone biosynthesis C-methylase UbiE
MVMVKNYSVSDIDEHYTRRHALRQGLFGDLPYANYGYWPREGMSIDEACNALTELMAKELSLGPDDRLLEVGCGYGASAWWLATHVGPREIVGIDATSIRIEKGRELMAKSGLGGRVRLQQGDATRLDFDDDSFSRVLAIECAFHFNTREDFLREAFRVLGPGGILAMTDIVPLPDLDLDALTPDRVGELLALDAKLICEANVYAAPTYEEILRRIGFEGVRLYSIKDKVLLQYADHLERVAADSEAEARERRLNAAEHFRKKYWEAGDYVVVHAEKPRR